MKIADLFKVNGYGVVINVYCHGIDIYENEIARNVEEDGVSIIHGNSDIYVARNYIHHHCFWGHPEVDLAMMQLFGGFGPECLDAYQEVSPLADGWRDRVAWYQLAPLLVHAILFGGGYGDAALRALTRYR